MKYYSLYIYMNRVKGLYSAMPLYIVHLHIIMLIGLSI